MTTSTPLQRKVARAGVDPIERIFSIEDHDAAYDVWKAEGVRGRILVHVDGHLDFAWMAGRSASDLLAARSSAELDQLLAQVKVWSLDERPLRQRITIANFVYPAISDGLVSEFVWVMPDPFWNSARARRSVRRGLKKKLGGRSHDVSPLRVSPSGVTFTVMGRRVTVCTLATLPRFTEPVLLDIDVDYLLTRTPVGRPPYFQAQPSTPWLWPSGFVERLRAAGLRTDLVTIASSVEGGFTPLRYKYFGDLLGGALRDPSLPLSDDPPADSAAEAFREATVALEADDVELARAWWTTMVQRDPSYRTVYATPGWREETRGAWRSALQTYERMIEVNPEWHVPHVGRGRVLWHFRRYAEAEQAFDTACALSGGATSAWHWLGRSAWRRGDFEAAHRAWTRAVDENPNEAGGWYGLAQLEARRGDAARAIRCARQCLAIGWDCPAVRWLLARTAWRAGARRLARRELGVWARLLPMAIAASGISGWRRIVRRLWREDAAGHWPAGAEADA